MKYLFLFLLVFISKFSLSQSSIWQIQGGLGLSGVNKIVTNNVKFDNEIFFNKKNNTLDNKFRNNTLHSGYLSVSKLILDGPLKNFRVNATAAVYTFSSVFYKEEKFGVTFIKEINDSIIKPTNDTINTPNWLVPKYHLPFIEMGLSREFKIINNVNIELGVFVSYMVELYGTSKVVLFDSVYYQWEEQIYYFNKEFPNEEFDQVNYGLRGTLHLFPSKKLHPILTYTQSLNDISLKSFNLNQHANIWALHIGLCYNFYHKQNNKINEHKNE